jgi:hypothetical protein
MEDRSLLMIGDMALLAEGEPFRSPIYKHDIPDAGSFLNARLWNARFSF